MKTRFYLAMAAVALLMSNCSQEETPNQVQGGTNTMTATIEGASRSAVTDAGVFSWTTGDAISVYNGNSFTEFTLSSGNVFDSEETITPSGVAIYPANDKHEYDEDGTVTINMPTEYAYGSTNAPMLAEVGGNTLQFKHLGGLMRFVVKGVPSTATSFTFTANSGITGDFEKESDDKGNSIITASDATDNNKTVTITFTSTDIKDGVMTFYIPLPTGTYSGYTVSVGDKSHTTDASITNTINRGTLLLMPTFTYDETQTDLVKGDDNIVVLKDEEEISLSVSDKEEVAVNVAEGATATLKLTASQTTNGTVTISDGSAENEGSQETSDGTLNVTAENVSTLNINTPTLTVKLAPGSYNNVEALTAKQTLIIEEGVTINNLVVNGGNVVLKGNVVNFTSKVATTITLESDIYLTQPWQFAKGSDVVLDLNGHCITSADTYTATLTTLLAVHNGAKLTVKDGSDAKTGSIDTKDGGTKYTYAAILLTTNPSYDENSTAELVVESGTLKGDLYAISGNGSRKNTKVTINGGTLSSYDQTVGCGIFHPQAGEITINGGTVEAYLTAIEMRGGTLVVEDGTLRATCKDATTSKANASGATIYGAAIGVSQHSTNNDLSVTIKGGTLTGSSALYEEDTCDDGNTSGISMSVTGGTLNGKVYSENCPSFITGGTFSDASAFNYLDEDANVKLSANSEVNAPIVITKSSTIELSDNVTLTGSDISNAGVIEVKGENAKVTLNGNGTVTTTGAYPVRVNAANAHLIIDGGTYTATNSTQAVYVDLGKATINGGTFEVDSQYNGTAYKDDEGNGRYTLNCWDTNYKNGTASIEVKGGTFVNFNPANNVAEGADTNFVAEGYSVTEATDGNNNRIYTVTPSSSTDE